MKRRERGKVEAKVEICQGSIKAWRKGEKREGKSGWGGGREGQEMEKVTQHEGGVKR